MNIYVGNLSFQMTEQDLRAEFEKFGKVDRAHVAMDKYTGKSKGFGFVEMPNMLRQKRRSSVWMESLLKAGT